MNRYKYPRTYHLPFSEGASSNDKILKEDVHFYEFDEVIITYKMDGENTTVYPDGRCHARSTDSAHRDYHSWLLSYIQNWCYLIPENHRVCGEYLFAEHSIHYNSLPTYFEAFSIWNKNICLSWNETEKILKELGIFHVPVVYIGKYDTDLIKKIAHKAIYSEGQEGIVVRNSSSFNIDEFNRNIAKYVRPNHVQTDEHWSNKRFKNELLE